MRRTNEACRESPVTAVRDVIERTAQRDGASRSSCRNREAIGWADARLRSEAIQGRTIEANDADHAADALTADENDHASRYCGAGTPAGNETSSRVNGHVVIADQPANRGRV